MEVLFPGTAENLCKGSSGLLEGIKWVRGEHRQSRLHALTSITVLLTLVPARLSLEFSK